VEPDHDALCRRLVNESEAGILYAARDGRIRLWNRGCEHIFGWSAAEALGQSMDLIIPDKHRLRHWEGWDAVMKSGKTKYGHEPLAVPALTKDGRRISIEFFIVLLSDEAGQVQGAGAIIQDVSARWERDKALRQKLAALESQLRTSAATG
jgi:PAS domain S-box-containing protein